MVMGLSVMCYLWPMFSPVAAAAPAPAPAKAERSPEVSLNPLVYGLPYSDQPSSYPAPVLLPSLSSLSSLTPVHPEKLPSMSITATSWWPETTPRLGSSPLL